MMTFLQEQERECVLHDPNMCYSVFTCGDGGFAERCHPMRCTDGPRTIPACQASEVGALTRLA